MTIFRFPETVRRVIKPRCPNCHRCQAEWVVEAEFTCPDCKTHFIIGVGFITILTEESVKVI